jgi:hypothetical protein
MCREEWKGSVVALQIYISDGLRKGVKNLQENSPSRLNVKANIYAHTHIFMLEPGENFNFSQCSLTVCLMFKRRYFFDCYFGLRYIVIGGSEKKITYN